MLRTMRNRMALIMWLVIIAFIGTIIFSWGMGGVQVDDPRRKGIIAVINGEEVKYEMYRQLEQNLINSQQSKDIDDIKAAELRGQAWDQLVKMVVVRQQIEKNNIVVSDDQVYEEIRNNPMPYFMQNPQFMTEGKFDIKKYQEFIDNPMPGSEGMFRQIESMQRERLYGKLLEDKIADGVFVSEEDIREEYAKSNVKASVKYLRAPSKNFNIADSLITEAELKKFYDEHLNEYPKMPEKRSFDYVLFSTEMTAKDSAMALEDINYVLEQVKGGVDFAEVAKNYSEDGSAANGGDLGFFGKGRMVPEFEKAAFEAKVGDIVGPIKTQFGYHVIKVTDKKMEKKKRGKKAKIAEVKASHILIKFKTYPSTIEDAKYMASNFREELDKVGFEKAAEKFGYKIVDGGFVTNANYQKDLGRAPGLGEFLFSSKSGDISPRMAASKGYYYMRSKDKEEARIKTLEELKNPMMIKIKTEKALELALADMKKNASAIKDTASFAPAAKQYNYETKNTNEFADNSYVPGVGRDETFTNKAFSMNAGDISAPFKGQTGAYIISLLNKKSFDEEDYKKKREGIKSSLEIRFRNDALTSWMDSVIKNAEIKDYRNLLFR